jgi:hypothetical protein
MLDQHMAALVDRVALTIPLDGADRGRGGKNEVARAAPNPCTHILLQ